MTSPLKFIEDPAAWDAFVSSSEKPHIMQSWAWGEVKGRTGWRPRRVVLERDGAWRAGLSILERDFPRTGRRFFYAPRGPLVAPGWTPADLEALFAGLEDLAASRRAVFLKIDPDVPLPAPVDGGAEAPRDWVTPPLEIAGFTPAPVGGGFSGIQPRCVFRLNIARSEEDVLKTMDQKTRYNIRLAEKKGVTIRPIDSPADIEIFYRILVETAKRDGFLIRPLKYFLDIRELLGSRGQAQYFLGEREGEPLAGALALTIGPIAWYAYGASANHGRQYMPNHLMQWTLIRWAMARSCRVYDFRAVPSNPAPTDPLYGLYRFKKGFGGDLTSFVGEFDRVYIPWFYKLWVRGWPVFKKWRKILLGRSKPAREAAAAD